MRGGGFPSFRLDFDRERASLRDVLRDDNLNPAPGIGAIREHKAIERLAVHSQVYRTLEAKPMTAKAQTERRSNAVVRQPKSDLSRRQPPIEFDDLDASVVEPGWALHADPVMDLLLIHKVVPVHRAEVETYGVRNLKRDRVKKSSCDQGGCGEETGPDHLSGPPPPTAGN